MSASKSEIKIFNAAIEHNIDNLHPITEASQKLILECLKINPKEEYDISIKDVHSATDNKDEVNEMGKTPGRLPSRPETDNEMVMN